MRQPHRLHFDLVDMKLFAKIADAKSVTRGAADTNISVAAASMRIKSLERALGAQLFNRTKRGMSLTQAGRVFEQHANTVLQQIDQLYGDLQVYSDEMAGHIRMMANPIAVSESCQRRSANFWRLIRPSLSICARRSQARTSCAPCVRGRRTSALRQRAPRQKVLKPFLTARTAWCSPSSSAIP